MKEARAQIEQEGREKKLKEIEVAEQKEKERKL